MRETAMQTKPASPIFRQRRPSAAALLLVAAGAVLGCSKGGTSSSGGMSATASDTSTMGPPSTTAPSNLTPVRGSIASVTDSMLTVTSDSGAVKVAIAAPLQVYTRVPAKLSDVKENSFVGVTSVAQPDGSQRATEIHIFPDQLRGTGEGSYLMTQQAGASGGSRSTMTNGTVTGSQMTNGTASAPRMTNGTISGQTGGKLTVQYNGGTQTITVPSNVSVTAIAPTQTRLTQGSKVIVLAKKQPDGTLKASAAMLADTSAKAK
jgi:hypothetical protein